MKNIYKITAVLAVSVILLSACVKRFDTPPAAKEFEYGTIVTINQVKALYDDELAKPWYERSPVKIDQDWAITGIVTGSDKKDGNLYKEGYIEDASSGLLLKFESTGGFYIGDSVIIDISNLYLGDYGDFIQLGGIPYTDNSDNLRVSGFNKDERMYKVSVDNPSHPTSAVIPDIKSDEFLGKLVKLENVQFAAGGTGTTYADALSDPPQAMNRDLEDCAGNKLIVRSSGYSTFASNPLPAGNGTIIGIVTKFNSDYQIIIRDIDEVIMEGERCAQSLGTLGSPVETLDEDFESFDNYDDIIINGWLSVIAKGDRYWIAKYYSNNDNTYMQASGFSSGLDEMETWVITQPVTLGTQKILTFRSSMAYWEHQSGNDPFELLFSTDFDGTNLASANWTPLSATLADEASGSNTWVESGDINLPVQAGAAGVIAFKYRGSDTESTSYRIDDIVVRSAK